MNFRVGHASELQRLPPWTPPCPMCVALSPIPESRWIPDNAKCVDPGAHCSRLDTLPCHCTPGWHQPLHPLKAVPGCSSVFYVPYTPLGCIWVSPSSLVCGGIVGVSHYFAEPTSRALGSCLEDRRNNYCTGKPYARTAQSLARRQPFLTIEFSGHPLLTLLCS